MSTTLFSVRSWKYLRFGSLMGQESIRTASLPEIIDSCLLQATLGANAGFH
jgi:hypothetical protein